MREAGYHGEAYLPSPTYQGLGAGCWGTMNEVCAHLVGYMPREECVVHVYNTIVRVLPQGSEADEVIQQAAAMLRAGDVVAFPTETVYGLGANAMQPSAVARIFEAKGRPSNNPLIVHVLDVRAARKLCTTWPVMADRLAEAFWPGPLTLVVPRTGDVPDIVTAGGPNVGIRVPSHSVARAILTAAEVPIAAPSANRSNAISPTRAEHVLSDLNGRIPLIIDGGPTNNLESTVIDVSTELPRILRPGPISSQALAEVVGRLPVAVTVPQTEMAPLTSPGQLQVHYAPSTPAIMLPAGDADQLAAQLRTSGKLVARLTSGGGKSCLPMEIALPPSWQVWQANLYEALHTLDDAGADIIVVDEPPLASEWAAVYDRLKRACARTVNL